jgi:hypothetical protein
MRLLFRFLIILGVCLIATAVPAVPAQASTCVPWDIELSPESGPPGTEVTVYGHDFAVGEPIDIYYDGVLVSEGTETGLSGDFTIIIRIPEDCSGHYHVHADVGYAEADAYFHMRPGLTVSPKQGPLGTNVTVEGQGFAENEGGIALYYYLSGSYETIESNIVANARGSWERSFQVPSSTRGEHKLDAEGSVSKLYEVQDAVFKVMGEISIDKPSGIVGETITVTGNRFAPSEKDIRILFDGEAVVTDIKADAQGKWEESFEVPEMPTGEYSVTAEGEQTDKEDIDELSFEIEPDILLSPSEGHVGMNLTVAGCGFTADEDVNIAYDGNRIGTVETNDKGSFDVSFTVPESEHGDRLVIAGYADGNAANAIFTMESDPPPIPVLISPANRSRLGFMGEVTPTFEWSEVSDDSGVYYKLQIATSDNVTATGEFANPLVSVTGLGETSYTLDETEALPLGTYYWTVQAVDGAENAGEWSVPRSFRVGLMPLWGLITIITVAVVLLVLLMRALIIRRTIYYDRW